MSKKKENNPQIEVRTFNWGPCVIKLKIQDDFKKVLLSEIKKSDEDYRHKLAGQIDLCQNHYKKKTKNIVARAVDLEAYSLCMVKE